MVKHAHPIMIACREALTRDAMHNKIMALFTVELEKNCTNEGAATDTNMEESKEPELQKAVQERVDRIFKSFEGTTTKKADTSKGFRSFMKS